MDKEALESITNLSARRGIIIPAFGIYGDLAGFYDYGPIGTAIRHNIEDIWRKVFITGMNNLEVDTTIVGPEAVFDASGHIANFVDPIVVCQKCKASFRADKILEEHFAKKGEKDRSSAVKKMKPAELGKILAEQKLKCEKCGNVLPADVSTFNLMLGTKIGPMGAVTGYLRPETAQGIFMDFKNIFRIYSLKLPIGIGQVGKAFRNEISPRQVLIRMREFLQMELEFFFDPEEKELRINNQRIDTGKIFQTKINFLTREQQTDGKVDFEPITVKDAINKGYIPNELFGYMLTIEQEFMRRLGFKDSAFRFRQHMVEELSHYSGGTIDLEVDIGSKFEEVIGNAYRTDFDLKNHQLHSKEDMSVLNNEKKVLPHVVELSFGLDRLVWTLLANSLVKDDGRGWDMLALNNEVSPYRYAIFPLQKDEKLMDKALEINRTLTERGIATFYSAAGSIGKRYARADEVGINSAITVDYQTLEDDTVTVRNIVDAKQVRKGIGGL
ncbi:MAG: glycine--tRNA ligase [Candidatus Micrarchaeota archaeon]|nr:glycine--tRNA ligase [Candidatus Micrarchaeota archaeon]